MKLLRAEYNRRAQLRPLLWESTIQLPLEQVYTRLKIVSRRRGGNQGETKRWSDVIWAEDSRRDEIWTEAGTNKANPCDVFGMLRGNKNVMTIVEGSPGIGKTTFCLKLAYDWANQSSSPASCPEFELVLLLKCRDIEGDLTEAITEQLFPKDMRKHARVELLRLLEDIENQERVLIILDVSISKGLVSMFLQGFLGCLVEYFFYYLFFNMPRSRCMGLDITMSVSQIRTYCFIEINNYTYIMFRLHKFDSQLQCTIQLNNRKTWTKYMRLKPTLHDMLGRAGRKIEALRG